jgi:hypothetical protein
MNLARPFKAGIIGGLNHRVASATPENGPFGILVDVSNVATRRDEIRLAVPALKGRAKLNRRSAPTRLELLGQCHAVQ